MNNKKINKKRRSRGQSLTEYGLILALIAVFCIGALKLLGTNVSSKLNNLAQTIGP
jgi:Flp pilus assembly pilin Flp